MARITYLQVYKLSDLKEQKNIRYTFTIDEDRGGTTKLSRTLLKADIVWSCESGTMCENSDDEPEESMELYVKFATGNIYFTYYKSATLRLKVINDLS